MSLLNELGAMMNAELQEDLLIEDLLEDSEETPSLFDDLETPIVDEDQTDTEIISDEPASLSNQWVTDVTTPNVIATPTSQNTMAGIELSNQSLSDVNDGSSGSLYSIENTDSQAFDQTPAPTANVQSPPASTTDVSNPSQNQDVTQNYQISGGNFSYKRTLANHNAELAVSDLELDLSNTFMLHSNEGAAHTIYLDFDGHETSHAAWTRYNNDAPIITEAFDLDGNSSQFSDEELQRIQFIWQRVAEDFIPFDVNVTTADPGEEALKNSGAGDDAWGMRVVIGLGDWLDFPVGGLAYLSTFDDAEDVPAFVFTNYLDNGNEKATAEAISHEVGHTLGLEHHGYLDQEYYLGHDVGESGWAPILGAGYYQELTQWSQGEYDGATSQQDDLSIITGQNGFGYRADDHGSSFENATYIQRQKIKSTDLSSGSKHSYTLYQTGIIEQNTDSDIFRFRTGSGPVSFYINPAARGANLDILAHLYDHNYTLIATSNPTDSLSASFDLNLNKGVYYLEVQGTGQGDPLNGGYSDYGSLGQYTIEAEVQDELSGDVIDLAGYAVEYDGYAMAGMALIVGEEFAFVAVQDGSWFDTSTWEGGLVPTDGAKVHIVEGITVTYDAVSDVRIDKIALDGNLVFATDQDTRLIVDTVMATETSMLMIGAHDQHVADHVQAEIIIDGQSAVSDEAQIEKGIISMGTVSIHGADKLDFVALQDAFAGDNTLILDLPADSTAPLGWQVGDRLVLGGTSYDRNGDHADNSKFQDEVLIITAINGNEISFINENITAGDNTVLRFDHVRPQSFESQVDIYVANTTRNVSISSENGADSPLLNRGHVMFMHSDNVHVYNAGFYDLGRTDKNRLIDDVGTNLDGSTGNGTNVRGRYSVHFHGVGVGHDSGMHDSGMHDSGMHDSGMHDSGMHGAVSGGIASGNAIVGSPGWGLVHHNSHATFEDNVVFDVVGSGIVSEGGAETGSWHNNITIKTTGDADPHHGFGHHGPRVLNYDLGYNGEGYWIQGAGQIEMTDNIAVSAAGAGLIVFGGGDGGTSVRDQHTIAVSDLPEEWQDIAQGFGDGSVVDVATVPLRLLSGFEAYNVDDGIVTWGTMLNGDGQHTFTVPGGHTVDTVIPAHEYRATVDDFKLWQVRNDGVQLWYSSQYDISNGLILANESFHPNGRGTGLANNGNNHRFTNLHVEGFQVGMQLPNDGIGWPKHIHRDIHASTLEDSYISGVLSNFSNFNNDAHYFEIHNSTFGDVELETNNQLPIAVFEGNSAGGLAYKFDGADSFDPDPWKYESKFETRGIVAWGWDFDSDGVIDQFGRTASHRFEQAGTYDVTLTVWDHDGVTTSLTQTFDIQPEASPNLFLNGDFSSSQANNYSQGSSIHADWGWSLSGSRIDTSIGNDGALVLSKEWRNHTGTVQVIEDDFIHQGQHELSVTLTNIDGNDRIDQQNEVSVSLFGINGQFDNRASDRFNAPKQVGALPFELTELLTVDLGGTNYDWQTFDFDVSLGSGFEYLVAEINTNNTGQSGDFVAIDSFSLVSNPTL